MRTAALLLALAGALALPTLALADNGLYVDGAIGQASVDDNGIDDNDTAFRLGVGWRFVENFGAEIGYQDLGEVGEEVAIGGATAEIEADGFYAGVAGRIPLQDSGFFLSARAGVYFWDATGRFRQGTTAVRLEESDNDFYVGIGAGYDFNEQFGIGIGYDRYQLDNGDGDFNYGVLALNGEVRF